MLCQPRAGCSAALVQLARNKTSCSTALACKQTSSICMLVHNQVHPPLSPFPRLLLLILMSLLCEGIAGLCDAMLSNTIIFQCNAIYSMLCILIFRCSVCDAVWLCRGARARVPAIARPAFCSASYSPTVPASAEPQLQARVFLFLTHLRLLQLLTLRPNHGGRGGTLVGFSSVLHSSTRKHGKPH